MNRNDDLLRTDAYGVTVDNMAIGRQHIAGASAPVADADGVVTAKARTKTTAWVASYATQTNSVDDTLTILAPAMMGAVPNGKIKFVLATSTTDELEVTVGTGDNIDTVTITVAQTTASNNTAAKIQAAIRALGEVNGIDVSGFICTGSVDWDTQTLAKKNDTAAALANGVTGEYDEITGNDITNPAVARNITATAGGTPADIANVAVYIYGLDIEGNPIEEELPYFTANSAGAVTGSKAFAKVTKILIPVHDGAAATTSIGFGSAFGSPFKLRNKLMQVALGGTWEASAPTVNIDADILCNNTVQLAGSLDGEKDVDIFYYL